MKKTILSTSITAVIALVGTNAFAEDLDNWEAELDLASNELENIDIEIEDLDKIDFEEQIEVQTENKDTVIESEIVGEKVEVEPKVVVEKIKAPDIKLGMPEPVVSKEKTIVEETIDLVGDISTKNDNVLSTDPSELIFLRYVPEGTRLTMKNTYKVLPKKKYIIMHNGERVISNPQTKLEPEKTFCYIKLKPSGRARILKAGTEFKITAVKSETKDTDIQKSYGNYTLRSHQVAFGIDNPNVVSLSCYSADIFKPSEDEEPLPLLIKDLKEQMGDSVKIDYAAYEEI